MTSNKPHAELEPIARQYAEWLAECPPSTASVASQLRAATAFEVAAEVRAPLLVLTSTADRLVSHECSRRIARGLKAELVAHDRGGHDLTLDEPEWICAEITRWLGTQ